MRPPDLAPSSAALTVSVKRADISEEAVALAEGGAGAWKSYYTLQTKDTSAASDSFTDPPIVDPPPTPTTNIRHIIFKEIPVLQWHG